MRTELWTVLVVCEFCVILCGFTAAYDPIFMLLQDAKSASSVHLEEFDGSEVASE